MLTTALATVRQDPLDQIIQLVVDSVSSPISKVMYARALANFLRWVRDSGAGFTKASVNTYRSSLESRGLSASSINIRLEPFVLYTFRHTTLTRWAAHMDPYTLAYLAGHSDFSVTKRYVHPQKHTVLEAMERARARKAS